MNKFNKITVCVEGKNIKVEVGTYTLRTLIIKKLNGMAAFKESKHQYKIWTISKRKNVRERLALEGKSKEEINEICNRINCFKWKLFAKRTKIDYIEGNVQFCHFLEKKYRTSYLTLKEAESIDKPLKDIIALISDEANNYYNILIDPRCVATISKQKNSADAYAYIDGRIKELYSNNLNWEDENFRNATRLLIDEWGESNKSLFDENHFPKVYPIKDSVSMNVVWTKNERQQLQTLKNSLNEEDLTELVTHIADFKDLSSRNKELEDENARLKQEVERLKSGRTAKVGLEESEMSKRKMYEAQLQAQQKLMEERPDWKFPTGYGECDEDGVPYCYSNEEVQDELGETIKIVLKSYRTETEPFKVNPTEWEWVVKENAKLLVYRSNNEIVEVPKDNLVKKQSTFSITFDSENLNVDEHEDRLNSFSSLLKYFNEMHFNFASFRIPGNAKSVKNIYAKKQGVQNLYSEEDSL